MSRRCVLLFFVVLVAAAAAATLTPRAAAAAAAYKPKNAIDNMIIEALESFRNHMADGWPELGVPPLDPLQLGHANLSFTQDGISMEGSLMEVVVNGLSSFNIDLVKTNLLFLKADVSLGIPLLDVRGKYTLTGKYGLLPIFGDGPFWIDVKNLTLSVAVDIGETEGGFLGVATLDLDMGWTTVDVHFGNIMGGGEMADFVNGILSSMAPDILQSLEDKYMPLLEEALKHEINQIIQGGGKKSRDESVNDYFDLVFANLRLSMTENRQDPLTLPGDTSEFTVTLFNQSMAGKVEVGPGLLSGLSSLHRAGDMGLHYQGEQDEAVWEGEVGLVDLQLDYRFTLTLPLFGHDTRLTAKMSFIHLSFETDVFLHQSQITLARCNVTEFGPVHFKETGAGPLDTYIYNLLANTLLGELQGLVATAVEGVVCTLLEGALASSG